MAGKRIFYLTSNELSAVYCEAGTIRSLGDYPATPEGVEMFAEYLQQEPDYPSAFLVDVIEEEFRIDTIPHVIGTDRNKLLERKLAGQFRATPFRTAMIAGREAQGRKDDRVLYSGLTKPEILEPWLHEVRQHKVPLMGVYSVPQLAAQLVDSLKIKDANALVLTIQKGRLLRQTFFGNGELKISRLTPVSSTDSDAGMNSIQQEVERSRRYLGRLQLLAFTQPMHIYYLSSGKHLDQYKSRYLAGDQQHYHALDLNEVAEVSGLKQQQDTGRCEWLFAHLLSSRLPSGNYVSRQERAYYSFYKLRKQMVAASVVLALGASAWSVEKVYEGRQLKSAAASIALETRKIETEYQRQAGRMPEFPYSPRVMRAAVESEAALAQNKPHPVSTLALIGRGLARHANIELDEVRWSVATVSDEVVYDEVTGEPVLTGGSAIVKAHLKKFPDSYQMAFKQVAAFMDTLKDNDEVDAVKEIALPLITDPAKPLVGESQRHAGQPEAKFEIEIVLRSDDREV